MQMQNYPQGNANILNSQNTLTTQPTASDFYLTAQGMQAMPAHQQLYQNLQAD
jgi:hypothetical protein